MVEVRFNLDSNIHKNYFYMKKGKTWRQVMKRGIESLTFNDEEWAELKKKNMGG